MQKKNIKLIGQINILNNAEILILFLQNQMKWQMPKSEKVVNEFLKRENELNAKIKQVKNLNKAAI